MGIFFNKKTEGNTTEKEQNKLSYYNILTLLLTIDSVLSLKERNSIVGQVFYLVYVAVFLLFVILSIGRMFKNNRPKLWHGINMVMSLLPIVLAMLDKHMPGAENVFFNLFQVFTIIWVFVVICDLFEFICFYILSEIKVNVVRYIADCIVLLAVIFFGTALSSAIITSFPMFNGINSFIFNICRVAPYITVLPIICHEQMIKDFFIKKHSKTGAN